MQHVALQVLQYDATEDTWTEIGTMKMARSLHAIVEADLGAYCTIIGSESPSKNKI